ncbi:MAG: BON domain-containing protein [Acidobacteria bacterium]|nr:BON domain-containing protein [Acidobacteriota bacterium]
MARLRNLGLGILGGAVLSAAGFAQSGQDRPMPDAQIESNVLKALASAPELSDQAIGTTTVYGTVTLTGSVRDEASRDKAEHLVATTSGVKKVVSELVVGSPGETANAEVSQPVDGAGEGQADGTMSGAQQGQSAPVPQTNSAPVGRSQTQPQQPSAYPPYPPQSQGGNGYPQRQPYPAYPNPAYSSQRPTRIQQAGQPVIVPAGTMLRVRINQAMDSRHTQPGTVFDGVVISDVLADGPVAIPRGAMVQGRVSDVQPGGDLRGRGGLALELSQVTLEGRTYPLATEAWSHQGYDKTGQTVGNTVGLGAVGAMIGAIAGGGPGALLGAGIGSVAGLGVSSASRQGEATVPSEAIVNFRLSQQTELTTVSQAELDRLGAGLPPSAGMQPQMRRRYYPPPPPPYYYPAPYFYPYYR